MKQRTITRREMLAGMATTAGAMVCGNSYGQNTNRPNFVFVLIDDQSWDAMGHTGKYPFLKTPNMDRLAQEGASFTNTFVTTSLCSPSRACFLTGCHAHRHGVRTNERDDPLPDFTTYPQQLQAHGYETAHIGKWHMAPSSAPRPGFDYWLSFRGQGDYENPKLNENGREFQQEGYMTDILTEYAVNWLKRAHEKPFCLNLWHKAVHGPFTPAPRHADAFTDMSLPEPESFGDDMADKPAWMRHSMTYGARREPWLESRDKETPDTMPKHKWNGSNKHTLNYFQSLLAVDESLGAVLDTLEEQGLLDNTVIIFSSDNGYFHGEHRRGDKRLMYEESIRIPLLMRYPKMIEAKTVRNQMALNIDVAPTILDLAGVPGPDTIQGKSLKPALENQDHLLRESFLYTYFQEGWLPGIPTMLGVRTEDWKLIHYPELESDIDECYCLAEDPHERTNLINHPEHQEKVAALREELQRLLKETAYTEADGVRPVKTPLALAAHYPCTTIEAGKLPDISGNNRHGACLKQAAIEKEEGIPYLALDGTSSIAVAHEDTTFAPSRKAFTVGLWCKTDNNDGVLISHGGQTNGYALYLKYGRPRFSIISGGMSFEVRSKEKIPVGEWIHLAGMLTQKAEVCLFVNGKLVDYEKRGDFIITRPNEGCTIGADLGTPAGSYENADVWKGGLRDIRIYWGEISPERYL